MELIKSTQDALSIAETFFQSGMFVDIKSSSQAAVKIMAGSEFGIPPFAAMSGIHIIAGKPTIGAGLMAQRIKSSGKYNYIVKQMSDLICDIEFSENGKVIGISTFTIEDAKRAGTKNLDKFPKNMLFARAISNGVRWFTPDVYSTSVYVPEEMADIQPIQEAVIIDTLSTEFVASKISECKNIGELQKLYKSNLQFANFKQLFSEAKNKFNEVQKDAISDKQ
jgi:tRNA-binding EMAP/Myf-like protein